MSACVQKWKAMEEKGTETPSTDQYHPFINELTQLNEGIIGRIFKAF